MANAAARWWCGVGGSGDEEYTCIQAYTLTKDIHIIYIYT